MLMARTGRMCPDDQSAVRRRVRVVSCLPVGTTDFADTQKPVCVATASDSTLFPKDLWTGSSAYFRHLRTVFYGRPEVPRPAADLRHPVPNIGHVIWIGGGPMSFSFALSVLSLLHCGQVDTVYVHGNRPPGGQYWKLIGDTQRGRVKFVPRHDIGQVFGQRVASVSHVSDVWRADILSKYGGLYVDTDALIVRPLTDTLRSYEAVAAYDWPQWHAPFPDIFNLGVAVGKPGSRFWRLVLESMRWFRDEDFSWNGLRQPYRVFERHPDTVFVEPRLQVICFESLCHPTWWPDYHNAAVSHLHRPADIAPLDWRNDTFAFHFTHPTPSEYSDPETLLAARGMFAEIGQHVLDKSGLSEYFRRKWNSVGGDGDGRKL